MRYTGVGHYINSLEKVREEIIRNKISFGLPAHYSIIEDVAKRIDEIKEHHNARFRKILDLCSEPKTILELTREIFPDAKNYQFLLAIDEVGAHVEYLWDRGYLGIDNIKEYLENDDVPARWLKVRDFLRKEDS
jgi:hypothetical protein